MMTRRKLKTAGLYLRISLDRTGQEQGVKRQEKECRSLAERHELEVVETFTENDVSAFSGKRRPQFERLLRAFEAGEIDVVIAWANDRLYRSARAELDLMTAVRDAGGKILTVKDGEDDPTTAAGRMKMGILAQVAEFESARKAERIELWHEDRASKGLPHGGGRRPFGYEWDSEGGTWRIRKEEAAVIRRIVRDLLNGRSLSGVVRSLNLDGVRTANGSSRWANATVKRMALTPTIAGLRVHKRTGTTVKGNWKGVITPTQRELLIALFNDPARPKRGGGPTDRKRLLSGILVCARCGSKMYGDGPSGYTCHKSWKGCGNIRIASAPLEDWVWYEAIERLGKLRKAGKLTVAADVTDADEGLVAERLELLNRRDSWAVKWAEGVVDDRAYAVGVKALDDRVDAINERLAASTREKAIPEEDFIFVPVPTVGKNFTARLTPAEILEHYELLDALIDKIEVQPASRRGARWDPKRLKVAWKHKA